MATDAVPSITDDGIASESSEHRMLEGRKINDCLNCDAGVTYTVSNADDACVSHEWSKDIAAPNLEL